MSLHVCDQRWAYWKIVSFEYGTLYSWLVLWVITNTVCGPSLFESKPMLQHVKEKKKLGEGNSFSERPTGIWGCFAIIRKRTVTSQTASQCGPYSTVGHFPRPALTSAINGLKGAGDLLAHGATEATGARWSLINPGLTHCFLSDVPRSCRSSFRFAIVAVLCAAVCPLVTQLVCSRGVAVAPFVRFQTALALWFPVMLWELLRTHYFPPTFGGKIEEQYGGILFFFFSMYLNHVCVFNTLSSSRWGLAWPPCSNTP